MDHEGVEHSVQARVGDTLLEVAKQHDIDVEGEAHSSFTLNVPSLSYISIYNSLSHSVPFPPHHPPPRSSP